MRIHALMTFKNAYLLPMCRNVREKDFFYKIFCRALGLGGYPCVFVTGLRRFVRLAPHLHFRIQSIWRVACSKLFFSEKQKKLDRDVSAFKTLFQSKEDILKGNLSSFTESDCIESLTELMNSLTEEHIDAIEWQLEHKDLVHVWILRAFAFLRKDSSIIPLREKCEKANLSSGEFEAQFSHDEAAFLLNYSQMEKLLQCLSSTIPAAQSLLDKLQTIPQAEDIQTAMSKQLFDKLKNGDILIDNVSLKIQLMGIHMPTLHQKLFFTQGADLHYGVLSQEGSVFKESMMSMFGYGQKVLQPIHLLVVSILRFKDEGLREAIARHSNTKIEARSSINDLKCLLDLHENPEPEVLHPVSFSETETCTSVVAKIVIKALHEVSPTTANPFRGYDINHITPNALKKCLMNAGLADICTTPSASSYPFLLPSRDL